MALQFFLTYRGVRVEANEPALDWQNIAQILKRSETFGGITYLITSELEFANNFVQILDQIKANGIAGSAILEVFHQKNDTREWVQRFEGKIDLIGSVKHIAATGLEKYTINTKPTGFEVEFMNNFDVEVNITDSTDLFENSILGFSNIADYINLKPLSIKKRLDIENSAPNSYDGGSELEIDARPDNYLFFWTMNFGTKNKQEFGDLFNDNATLIYSDASYQPDLSVTDLEAIRDAPHSPLNNGLEILKAETAGDYHVQFSYSLDMDIDLIASNEEILQYRYVMLAAIVDRTIEGSPVITIDILNSDIVTGHDDAQLAFSKTASINKTYSLEINEEIYIFPYMLLRIFNTGVSSVASINTFEIDFTALSLTIDGTTLFQTTAPQGYLIHELFSRMVNKITGKYNAFQSDFYGRTDSEPRTYAEDGEGSLTAILSGQHLRGWTVGIGESQRPLNLSFKDLYESEKAKHNLDIGILDGVVRIEPAEWFVDKINVSVNLGCVREMEIETDPKDFFNQASFGYSEWKNKEEKGGAGLQEFNRVVNFGTQLGDIKAKYLAVSKFVGAGYTIETVRRQQRSLDTEKETEYDSKIFMIALSRRSGDGSASNPNFENETYDSGDPANLWLDVSGVDFPEEVYNVRWQPARMARKHGNQIRLSIQQNSNDNLLAQALDGNNFSSQLKTEAAPVVEGVDIAGVDLGAALYTGQKFTFDESLSNEEVETIIANPFYHIRFSDAKGNEYSGVISGELELPFETNVGGFTIKGI